MTAGKQKALGSAKDPGEVDITVVLPTFNRAPLLERALPGLLRQRTENRFTYEVLVVDDGSRDHTPQVVAQASRLAGPVPVRYLYQENSGRSAARNVGVRQARGVWLAFFDDDQEATPRWLLELWQTARRQGVMGVAGRVVLKLPAGGLTTLGPRARRILGETPPWIRRTPCRDSMTSGNVLLHRSLFTAVGGFDELLNRDQDTDLFWRLEKAQVPLAYAPEALVFHMLPAERCQPGHLKNLARMQGVADSGMLRKYAGGLGLLQALLRRLGVALLRDGPGLVLAGAGRDRRLWVESCLGLWYAQGLVRGALFWTMPHLFPQGRFIREVGIFSPRPDLDLGQLRERFLTGAPYV